LRFVSVGHRLVLCVKGVVFLCQHSLLCGMYFITAPPVWVAEYCDERVCLYVCLSAANVSPVLQVRTSPKIVLSVIYGFGSVLVWRHCDMLCISGFMDDVILENNGLE